MEALIMPSWHYQSAAAPAQPCARGIGAPCPAESENVIFAFGRSPSFSWAK